MRRARRRWNKYKRKPVGEDILALMIEHSSKNTQKLSTEGSLIKKKKNTWCSLKRVTLELRKNKTPPNAVQNLKNQMTSTMH